MNLQPGDKVRVSRHVPFIGGHVGKLHKLSKKLVKVVLGKQLYELRPQNVQRVG